MERVGSSPKAGYSPLPFLRPRLLAGRLARSARLISPALLACQALLFISLLVFDRPLIRGDAVAYFMWTASFGKDFDMDLQNQAERFGPLNTYMAFYNPETGRFASVFAWGQGLVMLPSFWAARLLDKLPFMRVNDEWFLSLQAYPFAYSLAGMLQANLLTLATAGLAYGTARRLALPAGPAAAAALLAVWGTPLYYYSTIQPLYSHATATFAHTLGVFLFVRALVARPAAGAGAWLVVGLALGLAMLTRWQLALTAVSLGALLAYRRQWRPLLWLGLGFSALAWHVPYTLNWMYGAPFTVPVDAATGEAGFLGAPRFLWPVLFSGDRGLFVWSPLAGLSLLGLAWLARRHTALVVALVAAAAAQVFTNAGVRDWYAGESFGMRRLTEIYPVVALGAAALLALAGEWVRQGTGARRWAGVGALLTVSVLVVYAWLLIVGQPLFGYFSDPSFGYFSNPPPATALNIVRFLLSPPKFDLIWPMMEHHFGPWAWTWPGP